MSIYSTIGPLQWQVPIVDKEGRPLPEFQRYFQQLFGNGDFLLDNKQDQDEDLDALAGLTGTGYAIRTAANAWTTRSITVTVGHLSIANGDGVADATELGLPNSGVTAASYTNANITVDAQGRVTAASSGASGTFFTDEAAQDAVGAIVDSSLVYVDATPLLQRAALTGDVTAAAGSNATTIANDAVTFAKMLNASAASVLVGRGSASGAGDLQEITLGSGLTMTGTVLSASGGGGGSYTDEEAQDAVGTILTDSSTIDFTYNDAGPSITADVKAGSIGATELAATAVTPGSYTKASVTVDADGRITAAADGAATWELISAVSPTGVSLQEFTNLGGYTSLRLIARNMTNGTLTFQALAVSVDNGANYFTTSGNYVQLTTAGVESNTTQFTGIDTSATAARTCTFQIDGSNVNGAPKECVVTAGVRRLFVASLSPINAIRYFHTSTTNITGGTLYLLGMR